MQPTELKKVNLGFIKLRRQKLNLSLQELAEALEFRNASTYMKYENGDYQFRANHLPVLANKLQCTIENFFDQQFADSANKEYSVTSERKEVG
ncbi:Helix-turn-helix domain protein [compost metagenome]